LTTAVVALVWAMSNLMTREEIALFSKITANVTLASIIVAFIALGLRRKVNVYEAFIEGAKGGIQTSLMIIPYLVGMLVAISVLRNSGVLGFIVQGFSWLFSVLGFNTDFTPALPTALMKSVSGSGARAMMIDALKTYGVDSFVGRVVSIMQGSSDTTLYVIALYFGSVGITKTRYAVPYGLLADLAGVIAAVWVAYLFFH
jgi:spore maturation protein SpmB